MSEESLFEIAIHTPEAERSALLDRECAGRPELRARIEALLRADGNTQAFAPAVTGTFDPNGTRTVERQTVGEAGQVIAGRYTLVEVIGEGGMGSVWRAKQSEPVKRFVAIKLIKAGMDSKQVLTRFEAERQALAMMDHPNIAKILDGGLHEGRPYFAMELVKGIPITQYCDAKKLNPQQRLELFVPVCQAIQHAHQKGIIHRDIKPSNVLIALYDDKPVVKVIDFGVAKATGGALTEQTLDTGFGGLVGTPQYMSPEQATFNNLDIDTRSDVYSLGVLLYELLAGSPPFSGAELKKKGLMEILRVVREDEPPKPSTKLSTNDALPSLSANRSTDPKKLTGLLRNELDWIVLKALEKDRTRRYETANGFAADVQRYLSGEAVLAHPPSTAYRFKKFLRKNRGPVIAAGLVIVALLLGIVGTTFGLLQAESARKDAVAAQLAESDQRKKAEQAEADTLADYRASTDDAIEQLIGSKPELGPKEKAYLENTLKRWQAFANRQGDDERSRSIRAEGHSNVGFLWLKLGRKEEALAQMLTARDIREKLAAEFPAVPAYRHGLAGNYRNLGLLLAGLGKRPEAEEAYRKALSIQEKLAADFSAVPQFLHELASSYQHLAILLPDFGRRPEAEERYRNALTILVKLAADFPAVPLYRQDLANNHNCLGNLLTDLGKRPEAEEAYRKSLTILEKLAAEFPAMPNYRKGLAMCHNNLGNLLTSLGKMPEAEEAYRKALSIREKLVAEFPAVPNYRHELAMIHSNLGITLAGIGKRPEAEEHFRKALSIREKLAAEFPAVPEYRQDLAASHNNLGVLLAEQGKGPEAEEQYRKGLSIQEKLAADFPSVPNYRRQLAGSHNNLGVLLMDLGKQAEAEGEYRKALAITQKLVADFPEVPAYRHDLAMSHRNLGLLLKRLGKRVEAEGEYRKALAIQEKLVIDFPAIPAYRRELAMSHSSLGALLVDLGKWTEAEGEYRKALAILEKLATDFPTVPQYREDVVNTYYNLACYFSVASGKIADKKPEYADRAMELLQKSVKAGYKDAAHMKEDTDLNPLREREDFKQLLAELEKSAPKPMEKK